MKWRLGSMNTLGFTASPVALWHCFCRSPRPRAGSVPRRRGDDLHLSMQTETRHPPTAVILGAGFSYVAGLPLAKDLFDCEFFIPSKAAGDRFETVLQNWRA